MIKEFALQWPVLRQILHGGDGTGPEAMSRRTQNLRPKNEGANVARSICPYCAVGCGQLVFHKDGRLISIEGDPESPVSRGRLCPKGADGYELLTHSKRMTKVKYRRPFSKEWEDLDQDKAMEMIADRIWESRERTFVESKDGQSLMQTTAIGRYYAASDNNLESALPSEGNPLKHSRPCSSLPSADFRVRLGSTQSLESSCRNRRNREGEHYEGVYTEESRWRHTAGRLPRCTAIVVPVTQT